VMHPNVFNKHLIYTSTFVDIWVCQPVGGKTSKLARFVVSVR